MNAHIDATNVLVDDDCSGTIVDRAHGLVLTADHCIRSRYKEVERETIKDDGTIETKKVRVAMPGTISQLMFMDANESQRATYTYTVHASDYRHDLALLKIKATLPTGPDAMTSCDEPRRGDTVYAVGNPFAVLYGSVTKGIVASVNRTYNLLGLTGGNDNTTSGDEAIVQHSAPIEGGNSGGALYNDKGELVGVNVRGSRMNETLAFSVPLKDVREFLQSGGSIFQHCAAQ
jgi:S1-C subfamily serine protease